MTTLTRRALLCGLMSTATVPVAAVVAKAMAPVRPIALDPVPLRRYVAVDVVGAGQMKAGCWYDVWFEMVDGRPVTRFAETTPPADDDRRLPRLPG